MNIEAEIIWATRMLEEAENTFGDVVHTSMLKERAIRIFQNYLYHLNEVNDKGLKYING